MVSQPGKVNWLLLRTANFFLEKVLRNIIIVQATVVQKLDNAIHQINSVDKTNHAIRLIVIYLVDSIIHFLNNWALVLHVQYVPAGTMRTSEWESEYYSKAVIVKVVE